MCAAPTVEKESDMRLGLSLWVMARVAMAGLTASAVLGLVPASLAQPQTKVIEYWLHETPDDPNSPVVFGITLSLEIADQDGDQIGWDITSIEIREVGDPDTVWVEDDPSVPAADGLWWVTHEDPNEPTNDEFVVPPHLHGIADAQDPGGDDLEYDVEGKTYVPPALPELPPHEITAALDYEFTVVGDDEPVGGGKDEPVEIPPEDEPGGSD
jgi:hypothetical protein